MEDLEYITAGALMLCDQGGAPDFFKPDYNQTVKIKGCLVATNKDAKPLINIPGFKVCKVTGGPCTPATVPNTWQDTWPVKVKGEFSLIGKSTCPCTVGGKIEFMTSGQVPLPDDAAQEVKDLQEQAQRELDDSGQGDSVGEAGLVEGMIPVWGSGRDLVNDIQTGDVGGAVLNGAFLVWDVVSIGVGIFTFGAGTAAMQGAKAGVKGAIKAGAKMVSKEALQGLGKAGLKKLSKEALKKSIDDVAKKLLRTCVFACFPAGTLIDTEFGKRKIEDIKVGERVWAYDEETGETGLQEVIDLMQRETDHSIEIHLANEVITTTALHPFFVDGAWVDASELKPGDRLVTRELVEAEIIKTEFKYEPIKVFNFEVAHWHTYFVGALAWLVHNAGKCLSQMMLEAEKWFQNIMRGNSFNNVMNAFTEELAKNGGKLFRSEMFVALKNGKKGFVDSYIKGIGIIERKATDLAKISEKTAKSYIDDAAKYAGAKSEELGKLSEKVYLHVENKAGVSKEVLDHAAKKGVEIIDDISQIPGL